MPAQPEPEPETPAEAPPASPAGAIALVVGLAIAAAAVAWLCREREGAGPCARCWSSFHGGGGGGGGGGDDGSGAGVASRVAAKAKAKAKAAVASVPGMGSSGSGGGGSGSGGSALGASRGGTVSVRVVRATGLLAADKGGTSDPYVVVQAAGGKKAKTSVKKKTLDPEWDETLELSVLDAAAPLSFTVWDHDKVGTNDSLGAGEILLGQCAPGAPTALRVALSTQGAIEVVVTFSPAEPALEPGELTAAAAASAVAGAAAGAGAPVSGARAARAAAIAREAATPQVVPAVASGAAQRERGAPLGDTASRLKRLVTGGGSSAGQAAASSPADSDGLARAV